MQPDYWPWLIAYHRVREPLYRRIIQDLQLAPEARVLDAGSGDGFYSQLLASLLGPVAQIVAFDNNLGQLQAACDLAPNVLRCAGDLEQLPLTPSAFDAVWLCRSMHAARDPVGLLGDLAQLLRPGGKLVVVENDTAHYPILPLPGDFEGRLRDARLRYEHERCGNRHLAARYKAGRYLARWLRQVGLVELTVHTLVSEDLAPLTPEVEAYWRLFLSWDAARLEPYLSAADAATYRALFDPVSSQYLFSSPGCYVVELTTVAWASRP